MSSTTSALSLDRIADLFGGFATEFYGGESVTQSEHALQCAFAAEQAGENHALIAAALLHDVGHLIRSVGGTHQDDPQHQEVGAAALAALFGPEVVEPVRMHVPAKRYICAIEPSYWNALSTASRRTLQWQGGVMSPGEAAS